MTAHRIEALDETKAADFHAVLGSRACSGACLCTAHYHRDWETRGREHRGAMFTRGEHDGFLLYVDDRPAGWCQCAPLERFRWGRDVEAPAGTVGVSCIVLRPELTGRGLCVAFLRGVLDSLRDAGSPAVVAMGHRPEAYDDPDAFLELPAYVCERVGLRLLRDDPVCPLFTTTW